MHGRGAPLMDHGVTVDYLQAPADSEREFSCRREPGGGCWHYKPEAEKKHGRDDAGHLLLYLQRE